MATQLEYALMAGAAYASTRGSVNEIPAPQGWTEIAHPVNDASGFEAAIFQRGTEIVISFAGTGPGLWNGDWSTNVLSALGAVTEQLKQAALYYEQIKATNPPGTTLISFTGHSLGGGLAALMGVFFNKLAMTFDQAPFRNAANTTVRDSLASYLATFGITDTDLAGFTNTTFVSRENNVAGLYVEDEALTYVPFSRIGAQGPLPNGNSAFALLTGMAGDLHSQALLTAFEQYDPFRAVSLKLPNMIKLIFDSKIYKFSTSVENTKDINFIEHLVRHQALDSGPGADMLKHFTNDMQDIVKAGGKAQDQYNNLNKALIAFGIQAYYEQVNAFTKEAFESFGGGVRFDRAMIAGDYLLHRSA